MIGLGFIIQTSFLRGAFDSPDIFGFHFDRAYALGFAVSGNRRR